MHLAWPNGDVTVCSAVSIGIQRNLANCGEGYESWVKLNWLWVFCFNSSLLQLLNYSENKSFYLFHSCVYVLRYLYIHTIVPTSIHPYIYMKLSVEHRVNDADRKNPSYSGGLGGGEYWNRSWRNRTRCSSPSLSDFGLEPTAVHFRRQWRKICVHGTGV